MIIPVCEGRLISQTHKHMCTRHLCCLCVCDFLWREEKEVEDMNQPLVCSFLFYDIVSKKVDKDSIIMNSVSLIKLLSRPWWWAICFSYTDQRLRSHAQVHTVLVSMHPGFQPSQSCPRVSCLPSLAVTPSASANVDAQQTMVVYLRVSYSMCLLSTRHFIYSGILGN